MSGSLRTWYSLPDLDRLADRGIGLKGELELKALPRLNDLLHADRGSVSADLRFRKRAGWLTVELEYTATLELTCQRCLEGFAYPVNARVEMALVESEAVEGYVPEGCEPLVLEGGRLRPAELVEDELIMALPLVPRHAQSADCGALGRESDDLLRRMGYGSTEEP
jgi:uncharacterized protein